jgi:protocatechuate 3,4-dioxygenase beta subunit
VESSTKKNDGKEGYVEMEEESAIQVKANKENKIPISFEGTVFDENGESLGNLFTSAKLL